LKIISHKCQIKDYKEGVTEDKNGKKMPWAYVIVQEPGGIELKIGCTGITGIGAIPQLESLSLEGEITAKSYQGSQKINFLPDNPPVFKPFGAVKV
jgi:hypothetical protein